MTEPGAAPIGCAEVTAAAEKFQNASGGQLKFEAGGSVLLKGAIWKSMNGEQRDAFSIFAIKVFECSGAASDGLTVRDVDTGAQLFPEL